MERHDVGVLELPKERDLADGRARRALFVLESNLLESHVRVVDGRLALEYGCIGALKRTKQVNVNVAKSSAF